MTANPFDFPEVPTGNPFELPELDDAELARAQEGAELAAPLDPKTVGRARELAPAAGVPQETAERNLPQLEREQRVRSVDWDGVKESAELQRYLADPQRAAVVLDDVPQMLSFRKALRGVAPAAIETPPPLLEVLGARWDSGVRTASEVPNAAQPLIWSALGVRGPASEEERAVWRELRARPLGPTGRPGMLDDVLGAPLEQLPILARVGGTAVAVGAGGAAVGAGVGSLVPGVGTAAGAATGFGIGAKTGAAGAAFIIESGNAYAEFEGLTDENGQPLDEATVATGAVIVGAINAGLELVGIGAIAKRIPGLNRIAGGGRKVVSEQVVQQLRKPALRAPLMAAAREVLAAVGAEVGTEVLQETVNIEAGRALIGEQFGLDSADLGRLGETAVQTALGTLPLVGVGQSVQVTVDRIAQARQSAAQMEIAREAVAQAQVRQLSPQAFGELTEALAREAGIEDVHIPAQALIDAYSAETGLIPEQAAQELSLAVPEVAAQLEEALATGGDVRIPVGRYFGTLDERFGAALAQDVRLRPEELTVREAAAVETQLPEQVAREVELAAVAAEALAPAPVVDPAAAPTTEALAAPAPQQTAAQPWAVDAIRKAKSPTAVAEILALDRAQDALGLSAPLFVDPAGVMTGDEFAQYEAALGAAREKAQAKLAKELSVEARQKSAAARAEQRTFARAQREFQREVAAEVASSPVEQAREWLTLRVDREAAPEQRLDRYLVRELGQSPYGGSWEEVLPREMLQVGGLHPDTVAELFGYGDGVSLLDALVGAPTREQAVADGVQAKMLARFGDLEAKRVEAAVQDAAQNDAQFRALQIEERVLSRMVGGSPTNQAQVKAAARALIAERAVKDIRPQAYRDQARRAGLAAVEAVGQGNYSVAQRQKRSQILNLALEQESRRAVAEIEQGQRVFARFARKKATRARIAKAGEGEYLRQIDGLLERHGLRQAVPGAQASEPVAAWAAAREAEGAEVILSPRLRDPLQRAAWRDLRMAEFRDLRDGLKNLEALAKRESTLETRREKLELASVGRKIVQAIEAEHPEAGAAAPLTPTGLDRFRAGLRAFDASLSKVEFVIDALTGNDPGSMLRRYVWEPLAAAQADYNRRTEQYTTKLRALRTALGDEKMAGYAKGITEARLKDAAGRPIPLTKWNVVMIAMNMGNASNMEKLLKGYGWNQKTVEAVLDTHMDAADWKFVQGTWDLINELWPDVAALERRLSGVVPPKIQAQQVQTRHGTFQGGYFPVAYDPERSRLGQRIEAESLVPGRAEGVTRATTGHGHTIERTAVAAPLLLDPSVIGSHMDQVILDLTHREAILDAGRVLSRKDVDQAISRALGSEFSYQRFWVPWLRSIARDTADPGALAIWNKAARWVRHRGTVFKLGFRYTTLLAQVGGHLNGLRTLTTSGATKADWVRGVWESLGGFDPRRAAKTYSDVYAASPFMRDRAVSANRDLRDVVREASRTQKISDGAGAFALGLIGQVQLRMVDMPIWLAGYRAASTHMGMTEERAVAFADSMVRKSQGGGTKLDQSAFEQGGEFFRMLTMFYSYNNTVYNQLRSSGRLVRGVKDVPAFLASYIMYVVGPGLFSWAIYALTHDRVPDPEDDDFDAKLAKELVRIGVGDAASTVPFLREAWTLAVGDAPRTSTALDIFYREAVDAGNVQDGTDLMFDAMRAGALITGLPGDSPLKLLEAAIRWED